MPKIHAPNKQYTGVSASVPFVNGVGESSDPALLAWFRDHGYEVEAPDEADGANDADKPLDKMTVPELKDYADLHKIELSGVTKRDDILAAIAAAPGVGDQGGVAGGDQ